MHTHAHASRRHRRGHPGPTRQRRGFTLIELLVVIGIILALTAFVVMVFNPNSGSEKIRSAARIAQSAILGARDRALHAGAMNLANPAVGRRGVRFLRDPQDATIATGFIYLQPIDNLKYGLSVGGAPIQIENIDTDGDGTVDAPRRVRGYGVDWMNFYNVGALPLPGRIRIFASPASGTWYSFINPPVLDSSVTYPDPVTGNPVPTVTLTLATDLLSPDFAPPNPVAVQQPTASCEIQVGYELLPNQAPIALPSGVVIDLDWSSPNVTSNWPAAPTRSYIDILFSPRGMVTGPLAALGPIHFLLNDVRDATQNLSPIDSKNKGEKLILTLFPQTGHVATYPIDPTDVINNSSGAAGADGLADNLFRFAQLGSTAGQ
jgi:prepilin-type N-terminal cleavage/methylation domain-containing protein